MIDMMKPDLQAINLNEYEALRPERLRIAEDSVNNSAVYTYLIRSLELAGSTSVRIETLIDYGGSLAVKLCFLNQDFLPITTQDADVKNDMVTLLRPLVLSRMSGPQVFRTGFMLPYQDGVDPGEINQTNSVDAREVTLV